MAQPQQGFVYFPTGFDDRFPQSTMVDIDTLVNAALSARTGTYIFPLTQTMRDNGRDRLIGDSAGPGNSLAGALQGYSPRYRPRDPSPPPKPGPIHNIPVEILLRISQLVAPPRTRDGLYDLLKLTHICRFWRVALINQPRVWSVVFATQRDRRSFVEACLERSHPAPLDVTVDADRSGQIHPGCTCDKEGQGRLLPSEPNPCEWHFQFEPLAETKHSNRIRALDIDFRGKVTPTIGGGPFVFSVNFDGRAKLALGSCRFFTSSFPKLVALTWKNETLQAANHLFSIPPFLPTLRSLTYVGTWGPLVAQVNDLTSFAFGGRFEKISAETLRLFILNNRSLESLDTGYLDVVGHPKGPPVHLLHLRLLSVGLPILKLSTLVRVPALRQLSSLQISSMNEGVYTLSATGDGITLIIKCFSHHFTGTWEDLTGYAKPVIRHVRLYDGPGGTDHHHTTVATTAVQLMADAQTLEVGLNYVRGWYPSFLEELRQLETLKVIRFEVSGEMEPFVDGGGIHEGWVNSGLDLIENLMKDRFYQGLPFLAVERMVVSERERANREQDYVWRCFYDGRNLGQYVRPA